LESTNPEYQNTPEAGEQNTEDWPRFFIDLLQTVFFAIILFVIINTLSARVRVDGISMMPTLQNGEYILVSRVSYKLSPPERGDIIVFSIPTDGSQDLIKRVVGLPGETISIHDGIVFVNGVQLQEPYIASPPRYNGEWTLGEDQLFVLGDNRNDSKDSHQWGLLPYQNIIGKSIVIYWPPAEWKMVNHTPEVFAATP